MAMSLSSLILYILISFLSISLILSILFVIIIVCMYVRLCILKLEYLFLLVCVFFAEENNIFHQCRFSQILEFGEFTDQPWAR